MDEGGISDITVRNRVTSLLNKRIAAIVECNGRNDVRSRGLLHQLSRLRGCGRKRLVRYHVFAVGQSRRDDRVVKVIRCGDMHNLHVRVINQCLVIPVTLPRPELLRLTPA